MTKAFTDIRTGRIVGAKPNTRTWWHEKAHLKYNSLEFGMRNSFREEYSFKIAVYLGIFSLVAPLLIPFAVGSILIHIYYFLYEERWCWNYADKKIGKIK